VKYKNDEWGSGKVTTYSMLVQRISCTSYIVWSSKVFTRFTNKSLQLLVCIEFLSFSTFRRIGERKNFKKNSYTFILIEKKKLEIPTYNFNYIVLIKRSYKVSDLIRNGFGKRQWSLLSQTHKITINLIDL
jgi:hypothetical protein